MLKLPSHKEQRRSWKGGRRLKVIINLEKLFFVQLVVKVTNQV
jgi:hypothetical protein